jgi:hypothetical protein
MIVVPKEVQLTSSNVAREFFAATLGQVNPATTSPGRILSAFMAISSFGNIMVMTFVAARGTFFALCVEKQNFARTTRSYEHTESSIILHDMSC